MSLFENQFAARAARVAVNLASEDVSEVATESLGEVVAEAEFDQFAEERAELNAQLDEVFAALEQNEAADAAPVAEEVATEIVAEETPVEEPEEANEDIVITPALAPVEEPAPVVVENVETPGGDNIGEDIVVVPPAGVPEVDGESVDILDDSGDVDYEDEADYVAEQAAVEALEADMNQLEMLEAELGMMADSVTAIESFGINPTAMVILQSTGLLAGTALETMGLEAFGYKSGADPESQLAIEALNEKMDDKNAKWSAKIISMAKGFSDKVMSVLNPLWEKISAGVKALGSATWDKTKVAGAYAKAHPVKTILGVLAAIALVAGVVTYAGGGMPALGAKADAVKSYLGGLVDKIKAVNVKWPFGDIKAGLNDAGTKIAVSVKNNAEAVKSASVDALGWTKASASVVGGQLTRTWSAVSGSVSGFGKKASSITATSVKDSASAKASVLKGGVKKFGANLSSGFGDVAAGFNDSVDKTNKTAGYNLGVYGAVAVLFTVMTSIYSLMYKIVAFGFRVIAGTVRAIASAVGGKAEPAAA